ncbi:unnamed protein product [Clonostachys rhizophaga]|uniref:GH16 domain-containing protein n=2 Tax=Clonostachys TaxID=110564 RepID=A0A9N9VP74_9HYPO|nr:unnamed protein product [Clonostachys rhizophaga]CAI6100858.1 unnamed protein product [Clonostachys chloroleuca]
MVRFTVTSLLSLAAVAGAWESPTYSGWTRVWQDTFSGSGGSSPNTGNWNIITGDLGVNAELQVYTSSSANVQLSGGQTLQLVPWKDSSKPKGWTSGRIESKYTFTPANGKITRIEAQIMFGDSAIANKQGIWPAFWMLGNSMRNGVGWPACGEIDIMETVNGLLTGYGTIHCDVYPGGICNEGAGIAGTTSIPNQSWHTWRVEIDRRNSNYLSQTITWYLDGNQFHQVSGSRIGNTNVWSALAQSSLYIIFNVAVGGTWPGYPNAATLDGYGSRQEVGYVAHYTSN